MKSLIILASCAILLCGCGGPAQTNPTSNPSAVSEGTARVTTSPIPDDIGFILQCNKCVFVAEKDGSYIAGEVHNKAKQTITGYVMAVDFQDGNGKSIKKIPGLMMLSAPVLQPGESKDFKERVIPNEANVTLASVYFKKAGKDVNLSEPVTLKLNAVAIAPNPTPASKVVRAKR